MVILEKLKNLNFYPKVVLDVGANKGEWSKWCHAVFPESEFYLIEPQIEMLQPLEKFCSDKKASYVLCAAGEGHYKGTLRIWEDMEGSSFLMPEDPEGKEERLIDVVKIDTLIENKIIKQPDLVKMDIQGFELRALDGFTKAKHSQIIILEVSFFEFLETQPVFHEVVSYMNSIGFVVYDIFNFLKRPYDDALGQCDVCFVKRNSFLKSVNRWNKN